MFKVMAQGGNVASYRPTLVKHKISPTGRKISLDRGLNTLSTGARLPSIPPSSSISGSSSRRVSHPHYENISSLMMPTVSITVTQDDFFEEDSGSAKIDDQTSL